MSHAIDVRREPALGGLHEIHARRRQLVSLVMTVVVLLAAGVVLFSLASGVERALGVLDFNVLRISFVALAVVFSLYTWEKERNLRRAERRFLEAQVRAAALTNRLRELSALTEAGKAVNSMLSLDDVLGVILRSAGELLDATEGSVMLLDEEDDQHLRTAASVGIEGEARTATAQVGVGVVGRVAATRRPALVTGSEVDEIPLPSASGNGHRRSALSAPLMRHNEVVGVLSIAVSEDEREYTEHDLEAFTVFAEHAAIAIANAQRYEREKLARERLAQLDAKRREFVAVLTHDLKAPLTSILGFTRLLRRSRDQYSEEQAQEFLEVIDRQGAKMLEMVEGLVVATRLEEGQPVFLTRKPLELEAIIREQAALLRGILGRRRIEVDVRTELPTVYGDASAVEHIVANLLENAVKYSPDGSRVQVAVEATGSEVLVSVADEGPGIPDNHLPNVFDRYEQAGQPTGLASVGLGLFIVQSLAQAHGGRAWAENVPGGGARVTFTLPYRSSDR